MASSATTTITLRVSRQLLADIDDAAKRAGPRPQRLHPQLDSRTPV
jgi:hypothetical protein